MRKLLTCLAPILLAALPGAAAAGGVYIESHRYTAPSSGVYYHGRHGGVVLSAPRYQSHRVIRHYSFPPGTHYWEERHYAPRAPGWAPHKGFGHHRHHRHCGHARW